MIRSKESGSKPETAASGSIEFASKNPLIQLNSSHQSQIKRWCLLIDRIQQSAQVNSH